MIESILFLIIEYSGVPIGLLVYTVVFKQLANVDPISNEQSKGAWLDYGLELMLILSVSTVLYAVSFAGHSTSNITYKEQQCVLWCVVAFIIEFSITITMTYKIRIWGNESKKTKKYPNILALVFWFVLIGLIVVCANHCHSDKPVNPIAKAKHSSVVIGSALHNDNKLDNLSSEVPPSTKVVPDYIVLALVVFIILIIIVAIFNVAIRMVKQKAVKDYSKGLSQVNKNPKASIKNLQKSLTTIPDNSNLIIDIHMKLARLYYEEGNNNEALSQILLLQKTEAYKSIGSYLKMAILKMKFDVLLKMGKITEAEDIIADVDLKFAEKLKSRLFDVKKDISKNGS